MLKNDKHEVQKRISNLPINEAQLKAMNYDDADIREINSFFDLEDNPKLKRIIDIMDKVDKKNTMFQGGEH